jgi:catechol 2,3-dioxygenase-like lactoylglutathione lyase family enzyme
MDAIAIAAGVATLLVASGPPFDSRPSKVLFLFRFRSLRTRHSASGRFRPFASLPLRYRIHRSRRNVMIKELWNVGLKVNDLDGEVAFLREVGATLVLRERVAMVGEEREYAIIVLGGVRMLLFETVVFENLVSGGVRPGLTHAVYEVDDLDAEYTRIHALGAEVLIEPTEVSAAFGRRRLAFFRSPGGFVFEVMQVLERKI